MIQNYYILAGLIGIYSMVKTNDPVVILVIGILSMFSFSIGLSGRPMLNESNKIYLWGFRGLKSYFTFWAGSALAIILSPFLGFFGFFLSYFMVYQFISFVFWWTQTKYCRIKHPWLT
jgi:hypothetical protein